LETKSDLDTRRSVDVNLAKQWCEENKLPYIETSAKTGDGVTKAFEEIAERYNEEIVPWDPKIMKVNPIDNTEDNDNDDLLENLNSKKKNKPTGCCG